MPFHVSEAKALMSSLCRLLAPVGEHKSQHAFPSKGKRKRKKAKDQATTVEESDSLGNERSDRLHSPFADLQNHLTVGFNTTTRYLENLSRRSAPDKLSGHETTSNCVNLKPLTVVFVSRSDQPPILHSHLPLLIKTASLASPALPATRLVMLPKGAEERLGAALSIPRVGLIGLVDGAPNTASLLELIRQHVPEVEAPWLADAATAGYLPVNIKATQTTAPIETKSSGQKKDDHE